MIAFLFFLYLIIGLQLLFGTPSRGLSISVSTQMLIVLALNVMWLSHHITDSLPLHF